MIAVERRGRLGNQMFQYAFGLAAARSLGTTFAYDDRELRPLFDLEANALRRARRAATYRLRRRLAPYPIVKVEIDDYDEPETFLAQLRDDTQYAGFFQSERYFLHAPDDVRRAFIPRREHRAEFDARYAELARRHYVCCHVRRTDYVEWRGGVALPIEYYEDALRELGVEDETPVVFVGDDLSEVERAFSDRPTVRFERNTKIVDLQLMTRAAAFVSSNSSFSWWGGWLGARLDRPVVAPRHWFGLHEGRELPPAVIPDTWTQLPVRALSREAAR